VSPGADGPPELDVAVEAAHRAGTLLLDHFRAGVTAEWKGDRDPVTDADREAEATIRARIAAHYPDDLVVGEEGAALAEEEVRGRRRWYVDPLDGTTNFLKRRRRWAVSVAFCDDDDRMLVGVVHLPVYGETFTAVDGQGARCGDQPIRVTDTAELGEALVEIGALGVDIVRERASIAQLGSVVMSLRVTGSTVSDLVDVAHGRADGFWATRPGRWDLAAGLLIAREAGATVTDLQGRPIVATAPAVLAAAPGVHRAMLAIVSPTER
jgi:myo-inositol-1(or 4)-monophosphatase